MIDTIDSAGIDTVSDEKGQFSAVISRKGAFLLEVLAGDSLGIVDSLTVDPAYDDIVNMGTLELAPTGMVRGNIKNSGGEADTVYIRGLDRNAAIASDGRFTFANLAPASYALHITTAVAPVDIPAVKVVPKKTTIINDIDLSAHTFDCIVPETFRSDSFILAAFLDSQGIALSAFDSVIDTSQGRIRRLTISARGLSALHPSIGACDFLFTLIVSNNALTTIPAEIEGAWRLSTIDAQNNQITAIPPEVAYLQHLLFLKFNGNNIRSIPDSIYLLSKLRKLGIGANPLDSLPSLIGNLSTLEYLDIFSCGLNSIPATIGNLSSLVGLYAASNSIQTLPASITALTSLEFLQLEKNHLISLPRDIGELRNLLMLTLNDNRLTNLPVSISELNNLQTFHINANQICSVSDTTLVQWLNTHAGADWKSSQRGCP
ncbi:MAG: hypothetical protein GF350_13465 [Chitinivibrionales bacterium]|nr:hypothetical protein [Chitinivibrionales bacterium]